MPTTRITNACNHAYQLTQDVRLFVEVGVIPALTAHTADRERPTRKRDRAIECVYTRIATWLTTYEKLNKTRDMQAIGTGARCVFEHYLDLRWFERFPDDKYLDRFWEFPDVDRYWAAKKVIEHTIGSVGARIDISHYQSFIQRLDAKAEKVPAIVARVWGINQNGKPRWPKGHWSGEGNLRDRARLLGTEYEDTYIQIYPTLCALIHPGATPFLGDFEWLEAQVGYGYFYAFHHAWRATELVIKMLDLRARIPQLSAFRLNLLQWLDEAHAVYPSVGSTTQ